MPKEATPAAPAAPAAPVTAPAAPAAKPATPAARPSTIPKQTPKPKLSAKKALGLEETPRKLAEAESKKQRDRMQRSEPSLEFNAPAPEPETPAVTAPEPAPAVPETSTETSTETPATPAKIKVGEKEYTPEELEAVVKKAGETPASAPAAPAIPAAVEEQPPQEQPLSPEELAKKEAEFVKTTAAQIDAPMTEEDIDVILAGGKDAIAKMQDIRRRDMATSIMLTRKALAQGLNPVMNEIFSALKPLVDNHQQLQRYTVEQQFVAKHKDFVPHIETARSIAEELIKRFPTEVAKLSPEQFIDEVARQTDLHLTREHKRWFPQGNGVWRTPPAAPAPAAAPATAAPAAPMASPAAPAARPVRPPAANIPSGISATGTPDWKKSVAQSLR